MSDGCCSCHISPPCDWCMSHSECNKCGEITHKDDMQENNETCVNCKDKRMNETPWESVGVHLYRFKINGGVLYLESNPNSPNTSMVFVPEPDKCQWHNEYTMRVCYSCQRHEAPDAPIPDSRIKNDSQPNVSQEGELKTPMSARDIVHEANNDNRVYSQLCQRIASDINREFHNDKQILLDKIAELSLKLNTMQSDLREFEKQKVEPLQRLADTINAHQHGAEEFVRRVDKELSERIEKLEEDEEDKMKALNDLIDFNERIEKLESTQPNHLIEHAQDGIEKCFERIEKLESIIERIEKLEDWSGKDEVEHMEGRLKILYDVVWPKQEIKIYLGTFMERIEKLESENKMRQDTIACVDRTYDQCVEGIYKRLENLDIDANLDAESRRLMLNRIDKLEAATQPKECDHEWMDSILLSNPPQMICKKCKIHQVIGASRPQWLPGESPMTQSAPDHEHKYFYDAVNNQYRCTICGADGGKNVGIGAMIK